MDEQFEEGSQLGKISKLIKTGTQIFEELFEMKSAQIREKLKSICKNRINGYDSLDLIYNKGQVEKTSINDKPHEISVAYYDHFLIFLISPCGITFIAGSSRINIAEFDEHFKL